MTAPFAFLGSQNDSRMEIPANALVVGRYAVLPFYDELYYDLFHKKSILINAPAQHRYLADIQQCFIVICHVF